MTKTAWAREILPGSVLILCIFPSEHSGATPRSSGETTLYGKQQSCPRSTLQELSCKYLLPLPELRENQHHTDKLEPETQGRLMRKILPSRKTKLRSKEKLTSSTSLQKRVTSKNTKTHPKYKKIHLRLYTSKFDDQQITS